MSVRKREWVRASGEKNSAGVVDYVDARGTRRNQQFKRKADGEAFQNRTGVDVRAGGHTSEDNRPTVAQAGQLWLETKENAGLERTTLKSYRDHLALHIVPLIGNTKLSQLTVPLARSFEDTLSIDRSPAMVTKVLTSLGALVQDAMERGLVAQNIV